MKYGAQELGVEMRKGGGADLLLGECGQLRRQM